MLTFLIRLYTEKPEFGKEVQSDPELADFIWNGSDELLPMNQIIERTNKARLDYIKSTFGEFKNANIIHDTPARLTE